MSSKTPGRNGGKRNQSESPESSPQDKHQHKTKENKGRKNAAQPKSGGVAFNPYDYLDLIQNADRAKEAYIRHNKDIANLVEEKVAQDQEVDRSKKHFEQSVSIRDETERKINDKGVKADVAHQIYSDRHKYAFAGMSIESIKVQLKIPGTTQLLDMKSHQKQTILKTLLDRGISFNARCLQKLRATTDPKELERWVTAGIIDDKDATELKAKVGSERLEVHFNYRLVVLLDMGCSQLLWKGLRQSLRDGECNNACCVRKKNGSWKFILPSGDYKVQNATKPYSLEDIKRLLQSGPLPLVDNLEDLILDYPMEPSACEYLLTVLKNCATSEGQALVNVKKVNFNNIASNAQKDGEAISNRTLASFLQHATPNLETLVLDNNAIGEDIYLFKEPLRTASFVSLNNALLSRVQHVFQCLGYHQKGISLCEMVYRDVDAKEWQEVAKFKNLEQISFGGFKVFTANDGDKPAWAWFTMGLVRMSPKQFRFLEFVRYNPSNGDFDDMNNWLLEADNLEFFVLREAETSPQQVAQIFNSMENKPNLTVMDITASLPDSCEGQVVAGNGQVGCYQSHGSDEAIVPVTWGVQAFRCFGSGFPRNLTHLKLEALSLVDAHLLAFFGNLRFKTKLRQLSLKGNEKLTTRASQRQSSTL